MRIRDSIGFRERVFEVIKMFSVLRLMTMGWRKEGLNGLLQGASAELPIMDRAAEPPRIGLGSCRRRLLVARIQRNSEEMHASILLLPIFAGVTGDTELLADKLFQRLHRVFFDIASCGVIPEGWVMVLNLVDHEWVGP
jgi:hypothetical protein